MKHCLRWCTIVVLSLSAGTCGDAPSAPTAVPITTPPPLSPPLSPPAFPPATQTIRGSVRAVDGGPVEGATVISADDLAYSGEYGDVYWESTYRCSNGKQIWLTPFPAGAVQVQLRWSGSLPLDLWIGRHYEGLQKVVHGEPGRAELTVESANADTILVGIDALTRPGLTLTSPVSFEITVK
jgi:hypothetical protein